MKKDRTPIYPNTADYAAENNQKEEYFASRRANEDCARKIESAISENYDGYSLSSKGAKEVIQQFGIDRTLYVLANTLQVRANDGRISRKNREWADSYPVVKDIHHTGSNFNELFAIYQTSPGLLNLFIDQVRHEQLLRTPLKVSDIKNEAERLMRNFQKNPWETDDEKGFMTEISPDFLARAKPKNMERLTEMLPFKSLEISPVEHHRGTFAIISKDEDRQQPIQVRRSVRAKLKEKAPSAPKPPSEKKKKEPER